jgi:hypothetical protein
VFGGGDLVDEAYPFPSLRQVASISESAPQHALGHVAVSRRPIVDWEFFIVADKGAGD